MSEWVNLTPSSADLTWLYMSNTECRDQPMFESQKETCWTGQQSVFKKKKKKRGLKFLQLPAKHEEVCLVFFNPEPGTIWTLWNKNKGRDTPSTVLCCIIRWCVKHLEPCEWEWVSATKNWWIPLKWTRYPISFRKLSRQWLWWEDRVRGEPPAAAVPQLAAVQLSWSQALWKHSEKMADQSGPPPQPRQLRQETSQ